MKSIRPLLSYMLVESHVPSAPAILIPTAVTFLYGMIMLFLNYKDRFDGPYPFFRIKAQSAAATILWMTALTGAIALISLAVFLLGR